MFRATVFLVAVCVCAAGRLPYIIGGTDVQPVGKYPWQVSLQVAGLHFCGATLISPEWVLTAAHCADRSPSEVSVILGMHDLYKIQGRPTRNYVERYIKNPDFNPWMADIALIKLKERVTYNEYIHPISLVDTADQFPVGSKCVITGWGYNKLNDKLYMPINLQEAPTTIISKEDCQSTWGSRVDADAHVCAQNDITVACAGDSGGPLACSKDSQWRLVGLSSFSALDCNPDYPSVYTSVAFHREWVRRYTGV